MRTVCAFTEAGSSSPAFINISQNESGDYHVIVRGTGEQVGHSITIPRQKMQNLSDDLHYEFHAGSGG